MFTLMTLLSLQVAQLKKKQDAQAQLLRQKLKSDEAAKRLQDEIQRIKTQKVLYFGISCLRHKSVALPFAIDFVLC